MLPRLRLPPTPAVLALIALAFVVPGLLGHDPWKTYDAISVEIMHRMQASGDWLVPQVADTRWLVDPPFFYWVGLAFGEAFGRLIEFHEAVRIASGLFVLAALALAYLAARNWAAEAERRASGAERHVVEDRLKKRAKVRHWERKRLSAQLERGRNDR